jgi:tetratricopeptide (TPR) repeat protein
MDPDHFDDDLLAQYAERPDSLDEVTRTRLEAHLQECARCAGAVDVARDLAEALPDEETWWIADELESGKRRGSIRAFAARIAAEDREAERHLSKLVDSPYRFLSSSRAVLRRCRTGGAVRLLAQAAHETCERNPLHALSLAEVASQIADALPDDYYPADGLCELRGTAWKAVANAHRYLGRFAEGFKAIDRAEKAYRRLTNPTRHLARVAYVRSLLFWKQQNHAKALEYAKSAAGSSDACGDFEGFVLALNLEGILLLRLGRVQDALDRFDGVRGAAQMLGNLELEARAINNIGNCYADMGDFSNGLQHLSVALQLFSELKLNTEVLRAQWKIGAVALAAGDFEGATRQLTAVNSECAALGLDSDVALIKLDLAEARLMLGDSAAVRSLCREIIAFFRAADMITGALTAAAFLEENARQALLTQRQIDHVRRFVRRLKDDPDAEFARPPE